MKRKRPTKRKRGSRRGPRAGRLLLPVLATLLFVGILVVAVFPTRTYLDQRRTVASATKQLSGLQAQNASMAAEAKRLQSDAEIEQQARLHYDMVMPGEEVFHILPAPQAPLAVPDVWPFNRLGPRLDR